MGKIYTALGLMSGTSMDGIDASIIQSDGMTKYKVILDKYFEYPSNIYNNLVALRDKIITSKDLKESQKSIKSIEKQITIFHAKSVNEILKKKKVNIDFIGFHGQTIFHNAEEKITKQLGDGKLLSKLTKKKVVYDFRQNDLKNGGRGAPLAPIFHQIVVTNKKIDLPVCILNIGGISNITVVKEPVGSFGFTSRDIGPGNCLIDSWVRKNSKKKIDENGFLAAKGKRNEIVFEQAQELFSNRPNQNVLSFDVGMVVFLSIIGSRTPPSVSIPKVSGVTSSNTISLVTSPAIIPA